MCVFMHVCMRGYVHVCEEFMCLRVCGISVRDCMRALMYLYSLCVYVRVCVCVHERLCMRVFVCACACA